MPTEHPLETSKKKQQGNFGAGELLRSFSEGTGRAENEGKYGVSRTKDRQLPEIGLPRHLDLAKELLTFSIRRPFSFFLKTSRITKFPASLLKTRVATGRISLHRFLCHSQIPILWMDTF